MNPAQALREPTWPKPLVTRFNGTSRTVKNLGWLIKALGQRTVECFNLHLYAKGGAAQIIVEFTDGWRYEATFADATVCVDWITRRRNLQGINVRCYNPGAFYWDYAGWEVGTNRKPRPITIEGERRWTFEEATL